MKTLLIALSLSAALFSTDALSKDHRDDRQSHNARQDQSKHQQAKRSHSAKHDQRDNRQTHNSRQGNSKHQAAKRSNNSKHNQRYGHKQHVSPAYRSHQAPKYASKHNKGHYNKHHNVLDRVISHHQSRKALVGGLILGSLIHHKVHSQHGNVYWEDDYGSCYRVENRARGDVYIEVPHNKCH